MLIELELKAVTIMRYVQIQNDSIELGGIVQRTWRKRSTDDILRD